jgi:hypothetical protein
MIVALPQVDTVGKVLILAAPCGWEDELAHLKETHIVGKHEARGADIRNHIALPLPPRGKRPIHALIDDLRGVRVTGALPLFPNSRWTCDTPSVFCSFAT